MIKLALLRFAVLCTLLASGISAATLQARASSSDAVEGSDVFKQCVRRYNTSRMNPLPQQGYFNPNNGTNGSMITVRCTLQQPHPPVQA